VFIACGINHKTAPIHLRERLSLSDVACDPLIDHLMTLPDINEVAVLSTCNRTELYCDLTDQADLLPTLAQHTQVPLTLLTDHWYAHTAEDGIKHAVRVASGLDSMMIGEPQIFGQFKQAYAKACDAGSAKSSLKNIFPFVFRASKQIRHQSGINKHAISLASVAAEQILASFQSHAELNILIIGTGEMAQLVTKYLSQANVQHFWIASRTEEHAQHLASQYKAKSINITALSQFLPKMDVIITATACPIPFITKDMVEASLGLRANKQQFFLDLALPRNVNEDINQLPQVTLCNIDDLKSKCQINLSERQAAAQVAEKLVDKALYQFMRWSNAEETQRLISDYRAQMQHLANHELSLALQQLKQGECESALLQKLTHRLFKKLTHLPTISLRQAALEGRTDLLAFVQTILTDPPPSKPYETID
jgi:glutamyl-tRNA reductase